MDMLILLGQVASVAGLAYGAWICLTCAGKYNAESAAADQMASRAARSRAQVDVLMVIEPVDRRDMPAGSMSGATANET